MTASGVVITLLFCISIASAFIPRPCASNLTGSPAICCPIPAGFDKPCGGPERGLCEPVQNHHALLTEKYTHFYSTDIRFRWPERVFQFLCKCQGTFFGPDCSECWYGYEGSNCDRRRATIIRRNIMSLTAKEKHEFVQISMKLREVTSDYVVPKIHLNQLRWSGEYSEVDPFEMLVFAHYTTGYSEVVNSTKECLKAEAKVWNYGHLYSGFLPYHRYLLMWLEKEYQKVAKKYFGIENFGLPYWDWTNSMVCDPCINELIGGHDGEWQNFTNSYYISSKSPFGTSRWKTYCSTPSSSKNPCLPCHIDRTRPGRLARRFSEERYPTVDEVMEFLSIPDFHNSTDKCNDAENLIESGWNCTCQWKSLNVILHGNVHQLLYGTMDQLQSSMYDPLFQLHHLQIDRLFERWRRGALPGRNAFLNVGRAPTQCRDCYMTPFLPPIKYRDVNVDTRELGYTYDNLHFGSLSEKVKVAHWNNQRYKKTCPIAILTSTPFHNNRNKK